MASLNLFNWIELTQVAQRFVFHEFYFVNALPSIDVTGTLVQWDIRKSPIAQDLVFTTDAGTAHAARMGDIGQQQYQMPVSFVYTVIKAGDFNNLRRLGSNQRDVRAQAAIARHLEDMRRLYSDYLFEYLASQTFTGTVTITVGETSKTIDFQLPASHLTSATASWATQATNIIGDVHNVLVLIEQDYGPPATTAIHNRSVTEYLLRNTDIGNLAGQSALGNQFALTGRVPRFLGLNWIERNHRYAAANQTEGFMNPFIADDFVIFTPDFNANWIQLQRGTVSVPDLSGQGTGMPRFGESQRSAAWWKSEHSPTGAVLYHKAAMGVAVPNPAAWVYHNTTP